jgi:uncharacterized protein YggT (Ycf19 family)
MKRRRRQSADRYLLYNDVTEPMLSNFTTPIPRIELPRESGVQRILRGLGTFFSAIINKVNQLLALVLAALLLLLFTRFILTYFDFSRNGGPLSFAHWIFLLSTPLEVPFQNLLPAIPFNGYLIDVSTLVSILVYAIGITVVRQFLKVLAPR